MTKTKTKTKTKKAQVEERAANRQVYLDSKAAVVSSRIAWAEAETAWHKATTVEEQDRLARATIDAEAAVRFSEACVVAAGEKIKGRGLAAEIEAQGQRPAPFEERIIQAP